jgi:RNA polymerase sigma factor (sigma-70 family)
MLAKPAFELLYRRHWYELYCIACRQTGSRHDAEELVQALFEKIWARRDDLDVRHWGAFLAASLNNLIVDFHRRRQLQEKFLQQYNTPADIESPHEDLDHKAKMNEYIQRERRVELFYENKRWFTSRLYLEPSSAEQLSREQSWQTAGPDNDTRSQTVWPYPRCQRMVNGMRPVEDPAGKITIAGKTYKMQRFYVAGWVFASPTHYFFPIMQDELGRDPALQQNPGW